MLHGRDFSRPLLMICKFLQGSDQDHHELGPDVWAGGGRGTVRGGRVQDALPRDGQPADGHDHIRLLPVASFVK